MEMNYMASSFWKKWNKLLAAYKKIRSLFEMVSHPYKDLSDMAFWRRAIANVEPLNVDPATYFKLRITPKTKIATAGSCFAQHISQSISKAGFNYFVAEDGHPIVSESIRRKHNYGVFSARYGNIYTARQLLQLFNRAYGQFVPLENPWCEDTGVVLDPFRPRVQPKGFISEAEMLIDRKQHLNAVRYMFENLDVFIFTLGLTECWISKDDGAVFPLCPGVEGGRFDANKYMFYNQNVCEVIADLKQFTVALNQVNKNAQIVLTVSPVPLVATAQPDTHVLSATTYSKSVLRVAAETIQQSYEHVHYFPSYEIITGSFNRGAYYAQDLRSVSAEGVNHVMRAFLNHAASVQTSKFEKNLLTSINFKNADFLSKAETLIENECDEIALDNT
jgi:hypothetical protein